MPYSNDNEFLALWSRENAKQPEEKGKGEASTKLELNCFILVELATQRQKCKGTLQQDQEYYMSKR